MFKEIPLLSAIAVPELMNRARSVANFSCPCFEPLTMVGVFFLIISVPAVVVLCHLERRYGQVS